MSSGRVTRVMPRNISDAYLGIKLSLFSHLESVELEVLWPDEVSLSAASRRLRFSASRQALIWGPVITK